MFYLMWFLAEAGLLLGNDLQRVFARRLLLFRRLLKTATSLLLLLAGFWLERKRGLAGLTELRLRRRRLQVWLKALLLFLKGEPLASQRLLDLGGRLLHTNALAKSLRVEQPLVAYDGL
jgi:hypothetical protein